MCVLTVEGLCLAVSIHLSSSAIDQSHPQSHPWSSLSVDHAHWSSDRYNMSPCLFEKQTQSRDKVEQSREWIDTNLIGISCKGSPSSFWLSFVTISRGTVDGERLRLVQLKFSRYLQQHVPRYSYTSSLY